MSGLDLIQAIQSVSSPGLDRFFGIMTHLHDVNFYVLAFPLLTWFYDKRFTRYLVSVFLLGYWANVTLKTWVDSPRPPADAVRRLYEDTAVGPAFPSGHAQNPLMFWGAMALRLNRTWVTVAAAALVFLIGYSRLYGGLHWPGDVLGGWAIGALMLFGFERTRSFWAGDGLSVPVRVVCAVGIPLATLAIWRTAAWDVPLDQAGDSWKLAGAYVGFWLGSILEEEYVGFNPRAGALATQALKAVIGVALVLAAKEGLKPLLPGLAASDLLRYLATAMAGSLVAPWVFQRFLMAPPAGRSMTPPA